MKNKPKCSCYGGFDCEVCNPDYYDEMKPTDTPRTDAASFSSRDPLELMQISQQLERELVASKAEVERLRSQLKRAVEIADEFWNNQKQAVTVYHEELADELEQLKAEIK